MTNRRRLPRAISAALALAFVLVGVRIAQGQEAPPAPAESSFLQAPATPPVSPGGAFFRSLLIPGWGHAAVGAYSRGAFYFAAASGSGYMLFKSVAGRDAAARARDTRQQVVEAELRFQGTPEDSIPLLAEEDPRVTEAQALVDTRGQQVQDWAALGIFIVLLSGADAFVSAHLMDFPEPLEIRVTPREFGRVELGVGIPYRGPG
jgi:hypothetical protein